MYSAYIFDLDGTLLNTLQDLTNAVNYAMLKMNFPKRTLDEVRTFVGNGIKLLVKRSLPGNANEDTFNKAFSIFTTYYSEHLTDFTKPYEGIFDILTQLKKNGCKLAVLSNKFDDAAKSIVFEYFGDTFDMVVGKTDRFSVKPSPDSLNYIIDALQLNRNKCIYIGDSDVDVKTAHNAGLKCIGVTWGFRDISVLENSGADYIISNPNEIQYL